MNNIAKMKAENQYRSGRYSLLAIIVFSVINLFSIVFGNTYFLFSSYITQFLAGIGSVLYAETGDMLFPTVFILLGIASVIPYLLFWMFSKKHPGCMIAALVLFSLDSVLFLLDFIMLLTVGEYSFIYDLIIRILALVSLIMAVKYGMEAKRLESAAEAAPAPLATDDAAAEIAATTVRRITVSRKKSFAGMAAKFECLLDGQPVAVLKNGETAELTTDGNAHELVIKASGTLVVGGITVPAGAESKTYHAALKAGFFTNSISVTEVAAGSPLK